MTNIDAEKLKAEINRIIDGLKKNCNPSKFGNYTECMAAAEIEALELVLEIIDSLQQEESTEIDLEKELDIFLDNVEGVPRMWHSDEQIEWGKDIAKHFFELGLKTQKGK